MLILATGRIPQQRNSLFISVACMTFPNYRSVFAGVYLPCLYIQVYFRLGVSGFVQTFDSKGIARECCRSPVGYGGVESPGHDFIAVVKAVVPAAKTIRESRRSVHITRIHE